MKKKMILILASAVLVLAIGVGGTLAYLTAQSTVTNTFSIGNVALTLEETGATFSDGVGSKAYANVVPGQTVTKDPKVTVTSGSEDCYLFVEVVKNDPTSLLIYTSNLTEANGWAAVSAGDRVVFSREVLKGATPRAFELIKDNEIKMSTDLTNGSTIPSLAFKAYAVQKLGLTAAEAWAEVD